MTRHANGNGRNSLAADIEKIKAAIASATRHARGNATKSLHDSYDNIRDKTVDMGDSVVTYTKQKPIKSLGFAVLAGLAIGLWLRK